MNNGERLEIERRARLALSQMLSTAAVSKKLVVGQDGPLHEFDIYSEGIVIGGVTTATHKTSGGNSNTSACDRTSAEIFWLSLWPGAESRVHVLTDRPLADWLHKRFARAPLLRKVDIYHFDHASNAMTHVGGIGV